MEHNLSDTNFFGTEKIGKILAKWTLEKTDLKILNPDLLVTVPLHPKKMKKRGYNQLHLYTETLSQELKIPFDHTLIQRNFYKKAQAKRSRKEREETQNLFRKKIVFVNSKKAIWVWGD